MSRYCEFKSTLEDNLRDQFVCGLRSDMIRQRLFAEDSLDYKKAIALASTLEAAERDAGAVEKMRAQELTENVQKLQIKVCTACGHSRHQASNCRYKDFECSYCGKTGHLRRVCWKKTSDRGLTAETATQGFYRGTGRSRSGRVIGSSSAQSRRRGNGARKRPSGAAAGGQRGERAAHWLGAGGELAQAEDSSEESGGASPDQHYESVDREEPMYQMSLAKYKPVCMSLNVNNKKIIMEIDTGSALSCISKSTYRELFNDLILKQCSLNLKFYDGSVVKPLGYIETIVKYRKIIKKLDLYVLNSGTTNLLGRQWLTELDIEIPRLNVNHIGNINNQNINDIISRHKNPV